MNGRHCDSHLKVHMCLRHDYVSCGREAIFCVSNGPNFKVLFFPLVALNVTGVCMSNR